MLERSRLLATVPGLVHGFTTREGGVSQGRYASLNLGRKWGDDPAAVDENLQRVGKAVGFDPAQFVRVRQVHGVVVAPAEQNGTTAEADGVWCRSDQGLVVGVHTADCVPVLIADRNGRVACAVHSGWRGTAGDIVAAAVEALSQEVRASELVAAIGPCIELSAFEVGPEVADAFDDAFVDRDGFAKPHVDLVAVVRAQLEQAGLDASSVERVGGCTHAHPERYFSYRRDGAEIGQMLSVVGFANRDG